MNLSLLTAISPVDGRYRKAVESLSRYFSEGALIKYRVKVEIEYFIALCSIPLPQLADIDPSHFASLRKIYDDFSESDAQKVKDIEKVTNHDVKSVEYFLKEAFAERGLDQYREFIHFGLTSQDINNTAVPNSMKDAWMDVIAPAFNQVIEKLTRLAGDWKDIPMLARTHGQPASPTYIGKEIYVFAHRLIQQQALLSSVPFSAKFGGATGNLNAHYAAYPDVDWIFFADHLVNDVLGLRRSRVTTQIEPYDDLAAFCDGVKRMNTILIDLNRDMWAYISMDYLKQKIKPGEVGSSTMPHKVNPIDFENSEGNLGIANAVLEHLSAKLPISRLQRDLTDSTVTRNIGVPLAHTLIALKSLLKGLDKIILNEETIKADLKDHWEIVGEGIQTILRREKYPNPYEALKALTRTDKKINGATLSDFIDNLNVSDAVKAELKMLTPETYTGKWFMTER